MDIELGIMKERPSRKQSNATNLIDSRGEDFFFLFDLIACTCGKAATLRVLSYTAPSFEKLCTPRIQTGKTEKTETSLKIQWQTARLQDIRSYEKLEVAEYIVTLFPGYDWKNLSENCREAEFKHLDGGLTHYTVTVSAIVGQAKMKGATVKTFLPPFPPQNLYCYPSEIVANKTTSIKITWTTPRGEFHKYSLRIALIESSKELLRNMSTKQNIAQRRCSTRLPDEIWLPRDATEHLAENLKPGEKYQLELKSMTDFQKCLDDKAPKAVVLTKPLPPSNIKIAESVDKVSVEWSPPEGWGHSCLAGYKIQLRLKADGKILREEFISSLGKREAMLGDIISTLEYEILLASVCRNTMLHPPVNLISQATEIQSDFITRTFVALPRPPQNFRLESSQPTALKVKWDAPLDCHAKPTFNISLHPVTQEVQDIMGDDPVRETENNVFTFSKLPDIIGTGKQYEVSVKTVINISGKFYHSLPVSKVFMTKPLPPENISVSSKYHEFSWKRSKTEGVTTYKFKIKREDEKANDFLVGDNTIQEESFDETQSTDIQTIVFKVPYQFEEGIEYKINVYSLIDFEGTVIESDPCHAKVTKEYEAAESFNGTDNAMSAARRKSILTIIRNSPRRESGRRPSCFDLPRQNTFEKPTLMQTSLDVPSWNMQSETMKGKV